MGLSCNNYKLILLSYVRILKVINTIIYTMTRKEDLHLQINNYIPIILFSVDIYFGKTAHLKNKSHCKV